jgi:hypothetical protein
MTEHVPALGRPREVCSVSTGVNNIMHNRTLGATNIATVISAALAITFCVTQAFGLSQHGPGSQAEVADVGKLFQASCASCHLPPDPDHKTDRAWLNQVKDTA